MSFKFELFREPSNRFAFEYEYTLTLRMDPLVIKTLDEGQAKQLIMELREIAHKKLDMASINSVNWRHE